MENSAYVFNSNFSSSEDCTVTVFIETLDGQVKGNAILDQGETAYAHYFATVEKTKIVNGGVVKGKIDGIEFEFNIQQ